MPQNRTEEALAPSRAVEAVAISFADGAAVRRSTHAAVETPVEFSYGGIPHAVMMATPADLEDFVVGFSITEGVVRAPSDIRAFDIAPRADGVAIAVELSADALGRHLARRRTLSGRTSCGLCGVESLTDLRSTLARVRAARLSARALQRALGELERAQPLNAATRATHAAAWADASGALVCVREDVGRHNALDKLIGARLRAGADGADGFVLVTSRASFEMVEKTATFGAGTLVSISAPTMLAIERAEKLELTLIGVARPDGALVYAGATPWRSGRDG